MRNKAINTTLSCIIKSIGFPLMIHKKKIFGLFLFMLLGACASPTALIGPTYTLTSTGNIFQAGLSYSSNEMITYYTGKTPLENLKEITTDYSKKNINIQKQTLESQEFYSLIKNKIENTGNLIKISNQ